MQVFLLASPGACGMFEHIRHSDLHTVGACLQEACPQTRKDRFLQLGTVKKNGS